MELQETPPPKASKEITFNVINESTGEPINSEPLTEEAARTLAKQLLENDASASVVIRSNRIFLME
jgi:hypothetical protein